MYVYFSALLDMTIGNHENILAFVRNSPMNGPIKFLSLNAICRRGVVFFMADSLFVYIIQTKVIIPTIQNDQVTLKGLNTYLF